MPALHVGERARRACADGDSSERQPPAATVVMKSEQPVADVGNRCGLAPARPHAKT